MEENKDQNINENHINGNGEQDSEKINTESPDNSLLRECQTNLAAAKDKYVYLNAEFENYKRRIEKDRALWISNAQANVLTDILPIVDDFERALSNIDKSKIPENVSNYLSGFDLILKSFYKILNKYDIKEIEIGKNFDPELHEAIMTVDSKEHETGAIVSVIEKGYTHKGSIIRPAKVSVAK